MIDIGVARPSVQGQAMISTATALTNANPNEGAGPNAIQKPKVTNATNTTAGTKYPATTSARCCIGARLRCAAATIWTIRCSIVSLPTRSACMRKLLIPFKVPPITRSLTALATGIGSPAIIDSSTELAPSTTRPSTGTFSPGRTRSRSPIAIRSSGMDNSVPSLPTRTASTGVKCSSARIA